MRFDLLQQLYEQYGACMTAHLKGQYNLVIWDKQAHKVLVANDLLSRRPMYYCLCGTQLIYASSYCDLLNLLSESQGYTPCISEAAVQSMCQSGALFGDQTYLADVFYLDSYQAIVVDEARGTAEIASIQPQKAQTAQTLDDAIRIFDRLFTAAVQAQFQKNNEYGYPHFMALSGGMDSRACLLKAIACGYDRNITCVNYSQANSIDNTVSQQIAFDHHLDYLFYPMDAAVFMTRLSDALACNECQQSSIGSTGARTIARLLDQTRMGIMRRPVRRRADGGSDYLRRRQPSRARSEPAGHCERCAFAGAFQPARVPQSSSRLPEFQSDVSGRVRNGIALYG